MKLAITGKGGVGKTTLAATLARLYAAEGRQVLAADVDPDANLGLALGMTEQEVNSIVPVSKMKELAKERTAANESNTFYKLNPQVADLPDKLAKEINGVKLLVMGTVDTGGTGCVCPEHVMLKAMLSSLVFRKDDVVIMDMEAGLEHLGRGTASMMDQFIVVIEPGARSIQTYTRIKQLARDIGVTRVRVVANKVRDESDRAFLRERIRRKTCSALSAITPRSSTPTAEVCHPMTALPPRWRKSAPSKRYWIETIPERMNTYGII